MYLREFYNPFTATTTATICYNNAVKKMMMPLPH